jgi:hypothetical protein
VEKISKDIQEKSEKLADNGESTPYITKGDYLLIETEKQNSFSLNRGSQSNEIGNDLYRFEEYRTNRCLFKQKTQTISKQNKETNANETCQQRRGRKRLIHVFLKISIFRYFIVHVCCLVRDLCLPHMITLTSIYASSSHIMHIGKKTKQMFMSFQMLFHIYLI